MPVERLYVEGEIDALLISKIISTMEGLQPVITREGSKNSLKSKVIDIRRRPGFEKVFYLRDRDFDFDTQPDWNIPQPEEYDNPPKIAGWHWCRHEIENYLLEPSILSQVFDVPVEKALHEITKAALLIRNYVICRWTVGTARRILPPHYALSTRPFTKKDNEIKVPLDWDLSMCKNWAINSTNDYLGKIQQSLGTTAIETSLARFSELFTDDKCSDVKWVLTMYPGKDLFAALDSWFHTLGLSSSGDARYVIKEWMSENPNIVLEIIPEWKELISMLQSS